MKIFSYEKFKNIPHAPIEIQLNNAHYTKLYGQRFSKNFSNKDKREIISLQFEHACGYVPNLDNPQTFNEKLQWYKLNYKNPLMTICADKYKVREYIKEKLGEEYLVPLLGAWDRPEDIDFDKLPDQFVLKLNWGSGQNIIVKDKSKLNIKETIQKLKSWLDPKSNFYYVSFEWAYKDIPPKIIAEKYIAELNEDLLDYKFLCYQGEVKNLFVCSERQTHLKVTFFDLDWNRLDFTRMHPASEKDITKPKQFQKMLKIAKILSQDFPFVRVDLFEIHDQIFVGELTFYPGNGMERFDPPEWDKKFGDDFVLPKI